MAPFVFLRSKTNSPSTTPVAAPTTPNVPVTQKMCMVCHGAGQHTNPAVMARAAYITPCTSCKGRGVV